MGNPLGRVAPRHTHVLHYNIYVVVHCKHGRVSLYNAFQGVCHSEESCTRTHTLSVGHFFDHTGARHIREFFTAYSVYKGVFHYITHLRPLPLRRVLHTHSLPVAPFVTATERGRRRTRRRRSGTGRSRRGWRSCRRRRQRSSLPLKTPRSSLKVQDW